MKTTRIEENWELNPKYAKEVEITQKNILLEGKPSLRDITDGVGFFRYELKGILSSKAILEINKILFRKEKSGTPRNKS